MYKLASIMLLVFLQCQTIAQKTRYNITYYPGQSQLTTAQKESIKKISKWIKEDQTVSIFPLTHDTVRDRLYFAKNALNQGTDIAAYAQSIGFETKSIAKNFPSSYRGMSVSVNIELKTPKNNLKGLFSEKPSQFFIINPNKDTLIVGNEGTKLLFPVGSLLAKNNVKIELKEYYGMADYIKNGLPTVSNGQMIQTGGSIYLNATEQNRPSRKIKINPDKGVELDFTIGKDDPEMKIFVRDSRIKNQVNWVLPKRIQSPIRKASWQMTETIYNVDGSVKTQEVFHSKKEWEKHLKRRKEAQERELQTRKEAEEKRQKEYEQTMKTQNKMASKLKVYDLGFINCDKFYEEKMAPYNIMAAEKISAEYYLVFKDVRGVMKGNVYNQKVSFGKVPLDKEAIIIAVSFIDKQAYFYNSTVTTGNSALPKIIMKPVKESFVNAQLALLK